MHIAEGLSTRFILDSRPRIHDVEKSAESGEALLNHLYKFDENLNRADKDSDIESVHSKICRIHLTVGNKITAEYQCNEIHHALKEQIPTHETAHATVVCILGKQECMIAFGKLFLFNFFIGKGLYHADSAERILKACVDVSDFPTVLHESFLHPAVLTHRKHKHDNYNDYEWNGKPPVDEEQKDKGADNLDQRDKQVLWSVVGKFRNIK